MATITLEEAEKLLKLKRLSEIRNYFDIKTTNFTSSSDEGRLLIIDYCMTNYEFWKISKFSAEQWWALFKLMNAVLIFITEYDKTLEETIVELEEFINTDSRRCEHLVKSREKWVTKIISHVKNY